MNRHTCSFCGANEQNAKKIVAKGSESEPAICSECVVLCVNTLINTGVIAGMDSPEAKLLEKIERLELAAKRGLQINRMPDIEKMNVIPVEHCNGTLKNCKLFRRWINECYGLSE